jgi:hypothetical protein
VDGQLLPVLNRPFLHSARITFVHPANGKPVTVRAPLDAPLRQYLDSLTAATGAGASLIGVSIREFL